MPPHFATHVEGIIARWKKRPVNRRLSSHSQTWIAKLEMNACPPENPPDGFDIWRG